MISTNFIETNFIEYVDEYVEQMLVDNIGAMDHILGGL